MALAKSNLANLLDSLQKSEEEVRKVLERLTELKRANPPLSPDGITDILEQEFAAQISPLTSIWTDTIA